jgi:hypothetical protein
MKMNKQFANFLLAMALIVSSVFIGGSGNEGILSISMMSAGVFLIIYSFIMSMDFREKNSIFKHVEMPPPQKVIKEVRVIHDHHHYTECTEGIEVTKTLPNGTTTNMRYVKKWK